MANEAGVRLMPPSPSSARLQWEDGFWDYFSDEPSSPPPPPPPPRLPVTAIAILPATAVMSLGLEDRLSLMGTYNMMN